MYHLKKRQADEELDPKTKIIERVTIVFVGIVIYSIFMKIVFF